MIGKSVTIWKLQSILQHGSVNTMLLLDNCAGSVRRKVGSTVEHYQEDECNGPASDDGKDGQCDPSEDWSRCLGKDSSVQEDKAGFHEQGSRWSK